MKLNSIFFLNDSVLLELVFEQKHPLQKKLKEVETSQQQIEADKRANVRNLFIVEKIKG